MIRDGKTTTTTTAAQHPAARSQQPVQRNRAVGSGRHRLTVQLQNNELSTTVQGGPSPHWEELNVTDSSCSLHVGSQRAGCRRTGHRSARARVSVCVMCANAPCPRLPLLMRQLRTAAQRICAISLQWNQPQELEQRSWDSHSTFPRVRSSWDEKLRLFAWRNERYECFCCREEGKVQWNLLSNLFSC